MKFLREKKDLAPFFNYLWGLYFHEENGQKKTMFWNEKSQVNLKIIILDTFPKSVFQSNQGLQIATRMLLLLRVKKRLRK